MECGHPFPDAERGNRMQQNSRRRARAIAIAKARDDQFYKLGFIALAITMTAACVYGLMTLVF
jgi:hypothetical protein